MNIYGFYMCTQSNIRWRSSSDNTNLNSLRPILYESSPCPVLVIHPFTWYLCTSKTMAYAECFFLVHIRAPGTRVSMDLIQIKIPFLRKLQEYIECVFHYFHWIFIIWTTAFDVVCYSQILTYSGFHGIATLACQHVRFVICSRVCFVEFCFVFTFFMSRYWPSKWYCEWMWVNAFVRRVLWFFAWKPKKSFPCICFTTEKDQNCFVFHVWLCCLCTLFPFIHFFICVFCVFSLCFHCEYFERYFD